MCCHSSPWVSSKMLRVWMSGNAADLIWPGLTSIVNISWNLLQKSNVYNVWKSRRNTKGNGLSVCPVEWTKSFLPVLAQMSQASKRYLAELELKIIGLYGMALLSWPKPITGCLMIILHQIYSFGLCCCFLMRALIFFFFSIFFSKLTLNWFLLMCQ